MTAPDQGGVLSGPPADAETATAPGQAARDRQAEEAKREFDGWFAAQGYTTGNFEADGMAEAFEGGMQAARDLAAVTGDGSLRTRVTRLAEAWEGNPKLTEEGALLRDLGQILRDELAYSSDRPAAAAAQERPAPGLAELQALLDSEREQRIRLAGERDEARSDYSRLRAALLEGGQSDAAARKRCLAIIATAGTPPVDTQERPLPELLLGPCPFEGHDGEHLQLNTHGHRLCAIQLTNMLVTAGVITDLQPEQPAPDLRTAWRLAEERQAKLDKILKITQGIALSAQVTGPSKKSQIEDKIAGELLAALQGTEA